MKILRVRLVSYPCKADGEDDNFPSCSAMSSSERQAAVAQLVEHNVANVVVVGSNPISRSCDNPAKPSVSRGFFVSGDASAVLRLVLFWPSVVSDGRDWTGVGATVRDSLVTALRSEILTCLEALFQSFLFHV